MLSIAILAGTGLAYGFYPPYKQDFEDNTNILKFTGNIGPFSERRGIGLSLDPPNGCEVNQVILYHRHGERYPDLSPTKSFEATWNKIADKKGNFTDELEFANNWVPYTSSKDGSIGQESTVGPYNGLNTGYYSGMIYAARYGHLWDKENITPVFASGTERIVDTARKFVEGFFGYNTTSAAVNIIPETDDQGANTLVPNCRNKSIGSSKCSGDRNYPIFAQLANKWNQAYATNLTNSDIINLLQSTAYELNVRGNSPWVKAFPNDVWIAFEHYTSAGFWCSEGPGSPDALARGGNFINASRTLLLQGPEKLPLSFNFAHDTDIAPAQAFLGLDAAPNFNETYVQTNSGYYLSDIIPMGGRLTLERLVCTPSYSPENSWENQFPLAYNSTLRFNYTDTNPRNSNATIGQRNGTYNYVRVLVNEAVVPIDNCQSGPGMSCPLQLFSDLVDQRLVGRDFSQVCNLTENSPKYLDFWWNYNTTTNLNSINTTVAYQAMSVDYLGRPF